MMEGQGMFPEKRKDITSVASFSLRWEFFPEEFFIWLPAKACWKAMWQ